VVATNIAETSLTIDGIVFVVDSGLGKELIYDPVRNMEILELTMITQSNANQRKGRAGRTKPGVCYRLYTIEQFEEEMDAYPQPEITKRHMAMSILQLKEKGVSKISDFDFI
jgi:HrpA-like RNA helicase